MKNLLDSTLYFSVLTEDSQMQTLALDAAAFTSQTLVTVEDLLNVLQHPDSVSLDEHLVASRSGDDLLLSFRGSEDRPVLTLENFFTGASRLHILRQDGELLRGIVAQDNPQQGPVSFSSEPVGAIAQQPEAPALVALHQATVVEQPVAFSQLLTVNLDLQITHALDQVGARKGILESGKVTDDRWSVLEGTGAADSILEIYDGAELIGEVQVGKNGHWSFEPEQSYEEGGHVFTARVKGSSDTSNAFVLILDSLAPSRVIIERVVDDLTGSPITIGKNGSTADNTPLIEGKAEAYSMVAIYNGKTLIGTSFADANGKWSLTSFFNWPDGQYSITAQAIDHAGNAGLASTAYQFTINATPVVTPVIQQAYDDVGPQQGVLANNAQTDDLQPTLSGTAEANARVEIFDKG
ncbi:Ig-like domain-containing protein, partial [Aeromonas hydrophila]|uniref:Ig-like domain-containing protein n=1 Tax=Aeromonas hydrophila TaxID=644 RepID=UPI0022AEA6C4